jgi:hypothetical protein
LKCHQRGKKRQTKPSAGEYLEKLKPLYVTGGYVKQFTHTDPELKFFSKYET